MFIGSRVACYDEDSRIGLPPVFERGLRQDALRHERIRDSHGGGEFLANHIVELIARRRLADEREWAEAALCFRVRLLSLVTDSVHNTSLSSHQVGYK
jgi:hypothetical protein